MSVNATPLSIAYKNQGEYGYKIGVSILDSDGEPVDITGNVVLIYYNTLGVKTTLAGSSSDNVAYYNVLVTDFLIPGSYRFWFQCFERDIYGPFELKILKI